MTGAQRPDRTYNYPPPGGVPVLRTVLGQYRVLAYCTGVLLVILVFVGLPLQFWASTPQVADIIGVLHGVFFFPLYILATLHLGYRRNWSFIKIILVALAGVIPFGSFVTERRIVREEQELHPALPAAQP
jgi:integral membrane protein